MPVTKCESHGLVCPFPLQNQKHYKDAQTSNCTTHKGFANRQLLRQHIISEHLALCPKCFELKKAEGKSPEDKKKTPDKKIDTVLAWRRSHLQTCRPVGGASKPPPERYHMSDAQTEAFAALDHKSLVTGAVRDAKDYDFAWWKQVFKALYPNISPIPQPDTRYYIALPDFEKAVQMQVAKVLASRGEEQRREEQRTLKMAEIIVHAVSLNQIGLPRGVDPDPWKYQQLDPLAAKHLSQKFDMVKPGVLRSDPFRQPISDSGYGSHPDDIMDLSSGSPRWDMALDEDRPTTSGGHGDFSHLGMGAGPLRFVGGGGGLVAELTHDLGHYQP